MYNKPCIDQILDILSRFSQGASTSEIFLALDSKVSKRTLQRYLRQLIVKGILTRYRQGKNLYYLIKQVSKPLAYSQTDYPIPLSTQGEAMRHSLSKTVTARCPILYKKSFLYDHIPNQTHYLTPEVRTHLKKIGRQPESEKHTATFVNKILDRLLVDLSWNSSRLEGNTYSLLDTKRLVEPGQAAEGKTAFETRMVLNHKAAIEFLVELKDDLKFDRHVILNLHAVLSHNLLGHPAASGHLRTISVSISKTSYQPPKIPQIIEAYFLKILETTNKIECPFEK